MTQAERQRAYRDRQRLAVLDAYSAPEDKPTHVVLAALARALAQLDNPERASDRDGLRIVAGLAMRELMRRYGISVS